MDITMIYNRGINHYLKKNHEDVIETTEILEQFFNHISSCSIELQELLSNIIPAHTNLNDCYTALRAFKQKEPTLTIIVLCKNEERCIRRCLTSIFHEITNNDEVIVIDTGSTDGSLKIISDFSAVNLIKCEWKNDFSEIRNIGISEARNKWIFFIDADEELKAQTLAELKQVLNIIEWLGISAITIAPTIINHNNTVAQGVRRIIKKDSNIKYYGSVHEELRRDATFLGKDVNYISLDNVILFHDGYQKVIIEKKNKSEIYYRGLLHMISIEPMHPRWLYFLCRDNKDTLTSQEYEKKLVEIINLSGSEDAFKNYKVRAMSLLVAFYLDKHNLNNASYYLEQLKKLVPRLSDVMYYETIINYIITKQRMVQNLNQLIEYRQSHNVDYGSLDSRLYHIDYLIALLLFEAEKYKSAFELYDQLREKNGIDYLQNYKSLFEILQYYFS